MKILILDVDDKALLNSPRLDFITEVSKSTGEVSSKSVAQYHHCKITVYESGRIYFSGSIHKMFNSLNGIVAPNFQESEVYKGFNGNLFTLDDILEARNHIAELIECAPSQMVFENIEFGVNTTLDFPPKQYLKGLLYHWGEMFEYRYKGNYAQAVHQRFIFKIYNKSEQYGMDGNVLRVELKVTRTKELEGMGVKTFDDVNCYTLDRAKQMLLRRFDEVMHFDYTINGKYLTKPQNNLLKNYSNPRFWIEELKPNQRYRHKERLAKITNESSKGLHQHVALEIDEKCSIINQVYKPP